MSSKINKRYMVVGLVLAVVALPFGFALSFSHTYGNTSASDASSTIAFLLPSLIIFSLALILGIIKK